jgi:hypothetical protein
MPTYTPWGKAQNSLCHLRGVSTVSTSSHGGMMITRTFAHKYLSKQAIELGERYQNHLCYEEDVAYLIPLFDLREHRSQLMADFPFWKGKTSLEIEQYLIEQLSGTFPEYLQSQGVEPSGEAYESYKMRKIADAARANKDPDLITTAWSSTDTLIHGVLKVATADGNIHFVNEHSYDAQRDDPISANFLRLSECELIDQTKLPSIEARLIPFALAIANNYLNKIRSNPEESELELAGKFYGPRSRFNGTMYSTRTTFIDKLAYEAAISYGEASIIFDKKIIELYAVINDEFRACALFQNIAIAVAA